MQKIGGIFSRKVHQTRAPSEGYKTFLEMTTFILFLTLVRVPASRKGQSEYGRPDFGKSSAGGCHERAGSEFE